MKSAQRKQGLSLWQCETEEGLRVCCPRRRTTSCSRTQVRKLIFKWAATAGSGKPDSFHWREVCFTRGQNVSQVTFQVLTIVLVWYHWNRVGVKSRHLNENIYFLKNVASLPLSKSEKEYWEKGGQNDRSISTLTTHSRESGQSLLRPVPTHGTSHPLFHLDRSLPSQCFFQPCLRRGSRNNRNRLDNPNILRFKNGS